MTCVASLADQLDRLFNLLSMRLSRYYNMKTWVWQVNPVNLDGLIVPHQALHNFSTKKEILTMIK